MNSAWEARRIGALVTAFRRQTADGVPIALFLCGERTATGRDCRFVEVFIGGDRQRLPFHVHDLLLHCADEFTARELRDAIKRRCEAEALRVAREM